MRCPDCMKFVSYDDPEVEWDSEPELSNFDPRQDGANTVVDFAVSGSVVVRLNCAECSTQLKEATIEAEANDQHICEMPLDEGEEMSESDLDITYDDPEPNDYFVSEDKKGKRIQSRYQKHMYGFTASVTATCERCSEQIGLEMQGEETASGFEEVA